MLIYVDDILVTGNSASSCATLIASLSTQFPIKDLGELHFFLGLEVKRNSHGLFLCQTKYAIDLLHKFNMVGAKICSTHASSSQKLSAHDGDILVNPTEYRSLVGALQYLTWTRPELCFSVNQVCQFMHQPTTTHMIATKRILRFVKGTLDHGLFFTKGLQVLQGFSDADWAGLPDDRKSTSGFCLFFGNNPISWSSKKQATVARSSTEAEYRDLAQASAELVWICQLLQDLHIFLAVPPHLSCDNISSLSLASNPVFHSKMKHMALDFHFVRELVQAKNLKVSYISTIDQIANIFTKGLLGPRFALLKNKLSVLSLPSHLKQLSLRG